MNPTGTLNGVYQHNKRLTPILKYFLKKNNRKFRLMRKYISILFISLYSFALCQDTYPYFSDAKKQLKFEQKKIYISEVNEKEMVVSGGAQFNLFYLWDDSQPIIVPASIETDYNYIYSFEMKVGNKILSEIELLYLLGLKEEADKLVSNYNQRLNRWESNRYYETTEVNDGLFLFAGLSAAGGLFCLGMGLIIPLACAGDSYCSEGSSDLILYSVPFFVGAWGLAKLAYSDSFTWEAKHERVIPVYEQKYSNAQLQSLADSYNLKLYNEILNN